MIWIAPSEKNLATASLEKRLWDAADQFRANSGLKAQEYSAPVLGLIFLRFAEVRFNARRAALAGQPSPGSASHPLPEVEGKGGEHHSASGRGVGGEGRGARYSDTVLFVDARHIYRQVDRVHREWTPGQISFIANVARLYRGEELDFTLSGDEAREKIEEVFGLPSASGRGAGGEDTPCVVRYQDVPGLCRVAKIEEIEQQGWSLNPGRYVGVAKGEEISDENFKEQLEELNEELENLNAQARELESTIARNVVEILDV